MIGDYHVHTRFSTDSTADPEEYIKKAVSLGMKELCFTDHVDFDYPPEDGKVQFRLDVLPYFEKLRALKEQYEHTIKIKIGVELGLNPSILEENKQFAASYPFDFIIGSSHIIDGEDPYNPEFWQNREISDVISQYYEAVLRNVTQNNDYDVYGHLDYIRRYVPNPEYVYVDEDFYEITDMILKNIITKGHGIELNTRGLHKGVTFFIPTITLLKRYRDLGGEIVTVGSDAHFVKDFGYAFRTATEILENTGFRYVATYENRALSFIPIK